MRRTSHVFFLIAAGLIPINLVAAASGDLTADRQSTLRIAPPLPLWPSDYETITERRPVFRIEGRFAATRYRVELATEPGFAHPTTFSEFKVVENTGIAPAVTVVTSGEPLADGQYYWRTFCGDDSGYETPAANYRMFWVSDRDVDAVAPSGALTHPSLVISAADVSALREKVRVPGPMRSGWQYQVSTAYSALGLEPPPEDYARSGAGQHGNYSIAAAWFHRHLENVAFVGFVNNDERLIRKGVEWLMAACAYEHWVGPTFEDPKSFDPPWHATLETAGMTMTVATAYDLLYSALTEEQRKIVRAALVEKGVRPLVREWADPIGCSQIPRHQTPTGNWVMVCAGSGGLGALALLGEHPEAPQWVRLVRNRVRAWFHDRGGDWYVDNPYPQNRPKPIPVIGPSEPNFGRDGGYKESIGYMNYGTRHACFFAHALARITGENIFPHVPADLLEHMSWSLLAWPEGDATASAVVDFGDEGGATSWHADLFACLIRDRDDRRARWLFDQTMPAAIWPRSLAWYDPAVPADPPAAGVPMAVFRGIGQVVIRSGWSPQSPMAAIKFHQNRGHTDIGTFYLFGGGGPTVIDSGSANYGSAIYAQNLSRSVGHNVVLVDDQNQVRADGQMLAAVATPMLAAASGELKAAYPEQLQSWTRDLLMLPGGLALIHDELKGTGRHRLDYVLHPENPFELTGPAQITLGAGRGGPVLDLFANPPILASVQDGYHQTLPRKYVRFDGREPTETGSFLCTCRWPSKDSPPVVSPLGPGRWAIERKAGDADLTAIIGGTTSADGPRDLETDARVAAVWQNGDKREHPHAVVLGGRVLKWKGREWCTADQPVHLAANWEDGLEAHVWLSAATRLRLALDTAPDHLAVDGQPVPVRHESGQLVLDLAVGEHRLSTQASPRSAASARYAGSDLLPVQLVDAPAFTEGVRTAVSSTYSDGLEALDGNANTAWLSLPGLPMPQWLEVQLGEPRPMRRMQIDTGLPCAGRLEAWDPAGNGWRLLGRFDTTAAQPIQTIEFSPLSSSRLRAVFERIDPANPSASINSWTWSP